MNWSESDLDISHFLESDQSWSRYLRAATLQPYMSWSESDLDISESYVDKLLPESWSLSLRAAT